MNPEDDLNNECSTQVFIVRGCQGQWETWEVDNIAWAYDMEPTKGKTMRFMRATMESAVKHGITHRRNQTKLEAAIANGEWWYTLIKNNYRYYHESWLQPV